MPLIGQSRTAATVQIGGSARGYQAIFVPSTALASPVYDGQPAEYLYIAVLKVNVLNCRVAVGRITAGLNRRRRYKHVEMRAREAGRRGSSERRSIRLVSITVRGPVASAACACPLWVASSWRSVMKPQNRTIWSLLSE